jgi:hypothetical protein
MKWLRNGLALIGALSILGVVFLLAWNRLPSLCETSIIKTASTDDKSVKATVYRRECGAMAATRTFVALSNEKVDGSKDGDTVLTLLGDQVGSSNLEIRWSDNRHLTVAYPSAANVEYAVAKTRGVTMELAPR